MVPIALAARIVRERVRPCRAAESGRIARSSELGSGRDRRQALGDRAGQRGGIAFVEHGGGVDARHPALATDRVDDHVEVVPPVVLGGDQDLGAARSIRQHRCVVGVLVHDVLAAVDHGKVGGAHDLVGAGIVGRQVHRVFGTKSRVPQRKNEPVPGERLASGRADGDTVSQRQRLRPRTVDAGCVAGGVHGEHVAATRPHRAAGADVLVAPVERRPARLCRPHRVDRGRRRGCHASTCQAGHGDRQPRDPAGELDVGVEVQAGQLRIDEDVGGLGKGGGALRGGQRPHFALRVDGAGHIQCGNDAQFGDRDTGGVRDDLPIAGPVLAGRAQRIDGDQICCGA